MECRLRSVFMYAFAFGALVIHGALIAQTPPPLQSSPDVAAAASGVSAVAPLNTSGQPAGDHVAVVCPLAFQPALAKWIDYRKSQGYIIHVITTPPVPPDATVAPSSEPIWQQIKTLSESVPLRFLLLVGDGVPRTNNVAGWANVVPAARVSARALQQYGAENHIASDAWYADLNRDGFPELAVGRWPVQSPEDILVMTDKVINYEQKAQAGYWQRRVNVVAGIGGFSPAIDRVIEMIVRNIFTELLIADMELSLTRASWKSPFCPYPPLFRDMTVARINQGCLFWIYIGHGLNQELDEIDTPAGKFDVLNLKDVPLIDCAAAPPICLFFACYSGAFDSTEDSLAERMLLSPKGPVAILASSRMSMPYAMGVLGVEMFEETKDIETIDTLGNVICHAKSRMKPYPSISAEEKKNLSGKDKIRVNLDETARLFDPNAKDLQSQLSDHVDSMNLLGDPLLRVRYPARMQMTSPDMVYAAHDLTVSGSIPAAPAANGEVLVELVLSRNRTAVRSPRRKEFTVSPEMEKAYQEMYLTANKGSGTQVKVPMQGGQFTAVLKVPQDAFGSYVVRTTYLGNGQLYTASAPITIRSYRPDSPQNK